MYNDIKPVILLTSIFSYYYLSVFFLHLQPDVDTEPTTTTIDPCTTTTMFTTFPTINTTTYNDTDDDNNTTISPETCTWTCIPDGFTQCEITDNSNIPQTSEELEEASAAIKRELTVDRKSTSAYIRKLKSVRDSRTSSMSTGMAGIALMTLAVGMIVVPDLKMLVVGIWRLFAGCV